MYFGIHSWAAEAAAALRDGAGGRADPPAPGPPKAATAALIYDIL